MKRSRYENVKFKQAPCQLRVCILFEKVFVIRVGAIKAGFEKIVLQKYIPTSTSLMVRTPFSHALITLRSQHFQPASNPLVQSFCSSWGQGESLLTSKETAGSSSGAQSITMLGCVS